MAGSRGDLLDSVWKMYEKQESDPESIEAIGLAGWLVGPS